MEMETEERKALVLDAYDYKGAPADRAQTGGWVSAATILGKFPFHSFFLKRKH